MFEGSKSSKVWQSTGHDLCNTKTFEPLIHFNREGSEV